MSSEILTLISGVAAVLFLRLHFFASITIYDFQKGLLYRKGSFVKILTAGKHHYLRSSSAIEVIDIRKKLLTLQGQEILTKDNISVKISLGGFYEVADPVKAKHQSENYLTELHNFTQIALRVLVGTMTIEEFLEKKSESEGKLLSSVVANAEAIGLRMLTLTIKDIMLPANLKKAFSGVLEAQKEAQRQLEKARGEQAVLRNLANSSAMYESNPMLLQARLVQSLSAGNNSLVFNVDDKLAINKSQKN